MPKNMPKKRTLISITMVDADLSVEEDFSSVKDDRHLTEDDVKEVMSERIVMAQEDGYEIIYAHARVIELHKGDKIGSWKLTWQRKDDDAEDEGQLHHSGDASLH